MWSQSQSHSLFLLSSMEKEILHVVVLDFDFLIVQEDQCHY